MDAALFDWLPQDNGSLGFGLSDTPSNPQARFRFNRGAASVFTFLLVLPFARRPFFMAHIRP
jgi:hypothetical protein